MNFSDPITIGTFAALTLMWPLVQGILINDWLARRARRKAALTPPA